MSGANLYYDLVSILRGAGCTVNENSITAGWERRARSSGGFPAPPLAVFWHHTASSSSASVESDLNYMINVNDDAPVGNLLLDRDGCYWPIAGGASNCAGKGNQMSFSRGVGGSDSGNTWAWQIECQNNGVSEPWSQATIDALAAGSNALNAYVGNQPSDITSHALGAGNGYTDRKIDPATASAVQGPWVPRSTNNNGTWHLDDMRSLALDRAGQTPAPRPPTPGPSKEDSKLYVILIQDGDPQGRTFVSDLMTKTYIPDPDALAALQFTLADNGLDNQVHTVLPQQMAGYGLLAEPMSGLDKYGAMQ